MSDKKLFLAGRKGFTLIEVVMAIVLLGVFSYGISIYLLGMIQSWEFLTRQYQLEQDGKLAIDFLVRDLREIDIDSFGDPLISSASSSGITFTNSENQSMSYSFSNNAIYRNGQPLLKNVSSFQIDYYAQNNLQIQPPPGGELSSAQIKQIWYLYARFILARGTQKIVYSSYIFPRNFLAR